MVSLLGSKPRRPGVLSARNARINSYSIAGTWCQEFQAAFANSIMVAGLLDV